MNQIKTCIRCREPVLGSLNVCYDHAAYGPDGKPYSPYCSECGAGPNKDGTLNLPAGYPFNPECKSCNNAEVIAKGFVAQREQAVLNAIQDTNSLLQSAASLKEQLNQIHKELIRRKEFTAAFIPDCYMRLAKNDVLVNWAFKCSKCDSIGHVLLLDQSEYDDPVIHRPKGWGEDEDANKLCPECLSTSKTS